MVQKVVLGTKLPAKLWLDEVEDSCMSQILALASLPFAYKHIAIMPDAHAGKGMPIGGVLATEDVVIPNAVGVDIGCGMCAVKTNINAEELSQKDLKAIMGYVRNVVPVGFDHQKDAMDESLLPDMDIASMPVLKTKKNAMLKEIGTLGGGNHFIEIQKDVKTGDVWIMLHSGSRHVGLKVAEHYNKIAEKLCRQWYNDFLPGLAFLPIYDQYGKAYLQEMEFCKQFALANRKLIMTRVMDGFQSVCKDVEFEPIINIPHNYAAWENHFGKDVIVHRKGATRAFGGELGIIPGSMGTHSYIVEGLGNPMSFMSCSHGAGRKLSRSQAFKNLSLQDEIKKMDEQGIIHGMRRSGLDEAPGAYKDISKVMALQSDLVKPIIELAPLAVIKGD